MCLVVVIIASELRKCDFKNLFVGFARWEVDVLYVVIGELELLTGMLEEAVETSELK